MMGTNLYCHSRFASVGLQTTSLLPIAPPAFFSGIMSWGLGWVSSDPKVLKQDFFWDGMLMGAWSHNPKMVGA
jgi:hypothetical protein